MPFPCRPKIDLVFNLLHAFKPQVFLDVRHPPLPGRWVEIALSWRRAKIIFTWLWHLEESDLHSGRYHSIHSITLIKCLYYLGDVWYREMTICLWSKAMVSAAMNMLCQMMLPEDNCIMRRIYFRYLHQTKTIVFIILSAIDRTNPIPLALLLAALSCLCVLFKLQLDCTV